MGYQLVREARRRKLPMNLKGVWLAMADHAHDDTGDGCWASQKTLAWEVGCTDRFVRDAQRQLEKMGAIVSTRKPGRRTTREYRINLHALSIDERSSRPEQCSALDNQDRNDTYQDRNTAYQDRNSTSVRPEQCSAKPSYNPQCNTNITLSSEEGALSRTHALEDESNLNPGSQSDDDEGLVPYQDWLVQPDLIPVLARWADVYRAAHRRKYELTQADLDLLWGLMSGDYLHHRFGMDELQSLLDQFFLCSLPENDDVAYRPFPGMSLAGFLKWLEIGRQQWELAMGDWVAWKRSMGWTPDRIAVEARERFGEPLPLAATRCLEESSSLVPRDCQGSKARNRDSIREQSLRRT